MRERPCPRKTQPDQQTNERVEKLLAKVFRVRRANLIPDGNHDLLCWSDCARAYRRTQHSSTANYLPLRTGISSATSSYALS